EIKKEREREAAEEEADYQRQLAEYQREVLQVPIDNFNAFCGEGKKYEGTYGFNGGFKMNISIEFNNNNAKVNTIDGTLTFYCPSDRGEQIPYQYPFSLTCENGQVKGTITNKCPTVSKFRKDIGFIGLVGDDNKRGAMKFYDEILSDSTDIEIQFTHTVKLTITGKNGNRIEPNFNRLMFVPKQPGPPPVRKGALQNFGVGELVEAVNLNKEINLNVAIRASGFEADHYALHDHYALRDFVRYGSNDLKAKLYAASLERSNVKQFDDDAIRKANDTVAKVKADIEEKQKEIASKTFYCDCSYRVNNPRNHGDGTSGFDMYLNDSHGIPIPKGTKILFLPNVIGVTGTFDTYCFNVSGSTDGIGELVDGKAKYNVRVWCKDLRYDTTGTGRILDGINADVQKVEIVYAGTKP
ncbi:MAG: hypothetical protein LBU65_05395, partial [Planctomycetaceae bacterium]|nr:hypothetical protein [Planctomycetaceae bacterium]